MNYNLAIIAQQHHKNLIFTANFILLEFYCTGSAFDLYAFSGTRYELAEDIQVLYTQLNQ